MRERESVEQGSGRGGGWGIAYFLYLSLPRSPALPLPDSPSLRSTWNTLPRFHLNFGCDNLRDVV